MSQACAMNDKHAATNCACDLAGHASAAITHEQGAESDGTSFAMSAAAKCDSTRRVYCTTSAPAHACMACTTCTKLQRRARSVRVCPSAASNCTTTAITASVPFAGRALRLRLDAAPEVAQVALQLEDEDVLAAEVAPGRLEEGAQVALQQVPPPLQLHRLQRWPGGL